MTEEFKEIIWDYYRKAGRDLPWRRPETSAYEILVSEMMLQQTQVSRVIPKYQLFLDQFPSIQDCASATLGEVIAAWSGLGYNRRAKYLHEASRVLRDIKQPWSIDQLIAQRGIGSNTAAAVCTYAYNTPHIFIETNIRTVYIHHFFSDAETVSDTELIPFIEATLDYDHPREWYWALMDYGSFLKQTAGNATRRSKLYSKQSVFAGSNRQIRGQILKQLASTDMLEVDLHELLTDERSGAILNQLLKEGLVARSGRILHLPK